jgi:hypothetical protein
MATTTTTSSSTDEDEMELSAAQESMMDMTPVERRAHGGGGGLGSGQRVTDGSVVRSLRRLCVEAVADHFGRHSRELLNLNPAARELLLAHLKARFNPARRHRYARTLLTIFLSCACACACDGVH